MTDELKNEVVCNIRSTLLSCKGALTLQQCDRDYRQLQGEPIPYKKLGFNSLRKLLESIPGFRLREGSNGECTVDAVPSQNSMNIAALVSRQKSSAKKHTKSYSGPPRYVKSGGWKPNYNVANYNIPQKTHMGYFKPQPMSHKKSSPPPASRQNKMPSNNSNNVNKYPNSNKLVRTVSNDKTNFSNDVVVNNFETPMNNLQVNKSVQNNTVNTPPQVKKNRGNAADRLNAIKSEFEKESTEVAKINDINNKLRNLTVDPSLKENKSRLLNHCELANLPIPVFKTSDEKPKGKGVTLYHCTVKIGTDKSFTTYPNALASLELAIETASQKALNHLHSAILQKQAKTDTPADLAIERIVKIISSFPSGVFFNKLSEIYQEQYKGENLPSNWTDLVKSSNVITIENLASGPPILVLSEEKPLSTSSSTSSLSIEDQNLPPALKYPEDSQWNVFIMSANSTIEIWIRIISEEHSGAYEALCTEMEVYFMEISKPSKNIVRGGWYALKYEGQCLRVRVLEVNADCQTALCFLVDVGDEESHTFSNLYDLPTQFLNVAPQAILCRLAGLECFSSAGISSKFDLSEMVLGKTLVAEILQTPEDNEVADDPSITVILYDTTTDQDVNLNKALIYQLTQETQAPKLTPGIVTTVHVCEVTQNGGIYVQIHNENWNLLNIMINEVVSGVFPKDALQASRGSFSFVSNVLYLVKTSTGEWRRATLQNNVMNKPGGDTFINAKYIDFGITELVSTKDIFLLERLSAALNAFPAQVLELKLNNVPALKDEHYQYLKKLLPYNSIVLCKKLSHGSNSVEVFMRTQPHDLLCCVNQAINMEIELSKKTLKTSPEKDPMSAFSRKKERIFSTNSNAQNNTITSTYTSENIPKFQIPEKGSYFDVFVSIAANPYNFTVQSLACQDELYKMMSDLQSIANFPSLTTLPVVGSTYAAFYDKENSWYRGSVQGVISRTMVSVYFIDFGELHMMDVSKLKELPGEFKKLPAQAVKAKLYGVAPTHADWSVEDCIRFQEIVVEKKFASIVERIDQDPIQKNEPLLILNLIDTSLANDIYINDLLCKEGRATPTN